MKYFVRFLLLVFIFCFYAIPAQAYAAGNSTTINSLTTASTYQSISVYAPFTDDDNANNTATLQWKKTSDSTWINGMAMTVDRRATVTAGSNTFANPYTKQWRASVIGLTANTSYDIRVTFSDSDGLSGTNPVTTTVVTRNETIPLGGTTYYVAKTGLDTNPGTSAQPFLTVQKGVNSLSAGDTLLVHEGTYNERVNITANGSVNNWISIEAYPGETVTIDGQNTQAWNIDIANYTTPAKYIRIKGLKLINTTTGSLRVNGYANTSDIIIDGNTFEGFYIYAIYVGAWETANTTANVIIQNNTINRTKLSDPTQAGYNIAFLTSAGGHIIRNNIIKDTTGHAQGIGGANDHVDCIGGGADTSLNTGLNKDTDVYNNTITDCNDDAIQADGNAMNVRIWGNTLIGISTNYSGISAAPTIFGPLYVFRNVMYGQKLNAVKQGQNSTGWQYYYHNTMYITDPADAFFQTDPGLYNVVAKDNIIQSNKYILEYVTADAGPTLTFDYNNLFTTDEPNRFVQWQNNADCCRTYANFRSSTSQETHGINVSTAANVVSASTGDFHLTASSQFVDKGVIIGGFNDSNSSWSYLGSAPDLGAFEFTPLPTSAPTSSAQQTTSSPGSPAVGAPGCNAAAPSGTPDLFQIDTKGTQVTLFFSPVSGPVDEYYISYSITSNTFQHGAELDTGSSGGVLSYTIDSLSPNTIYYFRIRAGNGCMPGGWGNEMSVRTGKTGSIQSVQTYKNLISQITSYLPSKKTALSATTKNMTKEVKAKTGTCSTYTVKPGDSLWGIAASQLGNGNKYKEIREKNGLNSQPLRSGQKLQIGC